eukprot:6125549-Amphidinium_carterae.1
MTSERGLCTDACTFFQNLWCKGLRLWLPEELPPPIEPNRRCPICLEDADDAVLATEYLEREDLRAATSIRHPPAPTYGFSSVCSLVSGTLFIAASAQKIAQT